jgi:integrase
MNCRKCKKEIPEGSAFCLFCGAKQQPAERKRRKRGNRQGTAIKRGKTWTAVWTAETQHINGEIKQVRKTLGGFPTQTAALAYAANPVDKKEKPKYTPTLKTYYDIWEEKVLPTYGESKQCAYPIAWRRWKALHNEPICSLTINQLQACVDDQTETYYPAKDMKTLASHLFKRAYAEGYAKSNLAQFIALPPLDEKEQQPFTEEEIKKLWEAYNAGDRFLAYPLLMIYSGMMPGEIMRCTVDMVDVEKCEITGCGLKTKKRKKTPLVFPDWIAPMVADMKETTTSKKGYIVGMNRDNFYDEYHAALQRAGVRDLPPYSCRHTTATALAMAKTAPSLIQEIMRHTKFSTTQRYIHPDMTSAHEAVNVLK